MKETVETNTTIYPGQENPKFIYAIMSGGDPDTEIMRIVWDGISPINVQSIFGPTAHLVLIGPA